MATQQRRSRRSTSMLRTYYELVKPGIIYGNMLSATAGFFLAAPAALWGWTYPMMLLGLSCIIGCGCVLNNYHDRAIDARMERTKNRALVLGQVSTHAVFIYAGVLGALGIATLYYFTTPVALEAALFAAAVYVLLYTPLKPKSAHALFIGAVAGAIPPVVGYTAVTGRLDGYAVLLFLLLYVWQLPHFMAIATYRYEEYKAAAIPLFINKSPSAKTKRIARYIFLLSLVILLLACAAVILHRWIR